MVSPQVAGRTLRTVRHRARATVGVAALSLLLTSCGRSPISTPSTTVGPVPSTGYATPSTTSTITHRPIRQIVTLGDSVPAGTACGCTAFPELVTQIARRDEPAANGTNLASEGATIPSVNAQLDDATVRATLATADVVLLTVGANDLASLDTAEANGGCDAGCRAPVVASTATALGTLISRLRSLTPPGAQVVWTTYWNVFQDGDQGVQQDGVDTVTWSRTLTEEANKADDAAVRAADGEVVDLTVPFMAGGQGQLSDLLAADGDHPSAAGHRLIATELARFLGIG